MSELQSYEDGSTDPFYSDAVQLVIERGRPSVSYVQRKLKLGYNRAWRMIEAMQRQGIIDQAGPDGKVIAGASKGNEK
ncbi:hypothetical protein GCM10011533_29970 [Streptosporangium jomthongense]|uniref:DNA translocase FtsK n=1 Tax=Marinobacter aromaticivorans TaxID=1494078 RepID=A0ABW2IZ54_9GAMM|nr:DNA translocase FtsK [Marinobacter aromaticivorans]GGE75607.1 hypothetical protein GCM10011533_29970 [Streptosporangium jomthongense]